MKAVASVPVTSVIALVLLGATSLAGPADGGQKPLAATGSGSGAMPANVLADPAPARVAGSDGKPVTLVERSNPKIVGVVPAGWTIVPLNGAKMESDPVEVRPGVHGVIEVNPYGLVPDPAKLAVRDPGFDPALGNAQNGTVGAVLTRCIDDATELSVKLDTALKTLRAALNPAKPSMPVKTATKTAATPATATP